MYDDCNPLFVMPKLTLSTKWASPENPSAAAGAGGKSNGGRKGAPNVPLKAGASILLAEEAAGSGTIRRIWMTMENRSPAMLRGLRLDCCWDGAEKPAVSVPLGDFFGIGLGGPPLSNARYFQVRRDVASTAPFRCPLRRG